VAAGLNAICSALGLAVLASLAAAQTGALLASGWDSPIALTGAITLPSLPARFSL
jgi:hypothetical protein